PGAAARAIERASVGEWLPSFFWLAYSALWLAVVIWVWLKLLTRLTTGEGYLFSRSSQKEAEEVTAVVKTITVAKQKRDWFAWLPDDIAAIAYKEAVTVWRLPQRRAGII